MKKLFLSIYFSLFSFLTFAGPFGLNMGMTYSEISEACNGKSPLRIENDDRYYIFPEKNHSSFKTYIAWIDDEHGLYRIRGISEPVNTDMYGKEIQNIFYDFVYRLEAIYGKAKIKDTLVDNDSLYSGTRNWSYSLREGARELCAIWSSFENEKNLKDNISDLYLYIVPASNLGYSFLMLIEYDFFNVYDVEETEDSVL